MIHNIYSVRDNIAEQFMGGFESVNDGTAIRTFKDACNDENQLGKNVKDYTLFKVAKFDDESGEYWNDKHKLQDGKRNTKPPETMVTI